MSFFCASSFNSFPTVCNSFVDANNRNFLEFFKRLFNYDCDLKNHLEKSSFKYINHQSQDQFLSLISQQIKSHIVKSMETFYSIIVDETIDLA